MILRYILLSQFAVNDPELQDDDRVLNFCGAYVVFEFTRVEHWLFAIKQFVEDNKFVNVSDVPAIKGSLICFFFLMEAMLLNDGLCILVGVNYDMIFTAKARNRQRSSALNKRWWWRRSHGPR